MDMKKSVSEYIRQRKKQDKDPYFFSFDTVGFFRNEYVPSYSHTPTVEIPYSTVLSFAIRRAQFHESVKRREKKGDIDYNTLRGMGIEYEIPFKRFQTNENDIVSDQISFYSLLMVTIGTNEDEMKSAFIKHEKKLMLYRLRASELSISEIDSYFWPDKTLRNDLIASFTNQNNSFQLDFNRAFKFFNPAQVNLQEGNAILSIDNIYKIVTMNFGYLLEKKIKKFSKKVNLPAIESISEDFSKLFKKKKEKLLTLETFEVVANRSFPPCMLRICDALKKSRNLTYKGQFELTLFLKGCGLGFAEQNEFWKISNNPNLVNLKSIFDLSAGGKNFCPHSCATMTTREEPKKFNQVQGCPFRYLAKSEMQMFLKKKRRDISMSEISAVVENMPNHPQVACKQFFDLIFKESPFEKSEISHPMEFFLKSEQKIRNNANQSGN